MIEAAQAAILVAPVDQRRPAVRAMLVQHPENVAGIPEDDEILAEQARADRRAVLFRHLLGQAHRQPVAAHQLPHGGGALDPAQQLVLLAAQHGYT